MFISSTNGGKLDLVHLLMGKGPVLYIHLRVENEVTWGHCRECKQQGEFDNGMLSLMTIVNTREKWTIYTMGTLDNIIPMFLVLRPGFLFCTTVSDRFDTGQLMDC